METQCVVMCIVIDVHMTVNDIKLLKFPWKRNNGLPLHCYRAAKYFVLLLTILTYLGLSMCSHRYFCPI